MTPALRSRSEAALAAMDAALGDGPDVEHSTIRRAVVDLVAFRDATIAACRAGDADTSLLDRANSLTSLAYGAEFPLSGLHLRRMKQTRDGLQALLAGCPSPASH